MRINQHQAPEAQVNSPDFVRDLDTGELREVDIGIHSSNGSGNIFIAIECRDRRAQQSVEWIEQLISKKKSVGASVLIAISASEFSRPARIKALRHGVLLARVSSKLPSEIAALQSSLWLQIRYLAPVILKVRIETASPTTIDENTRFRHKLADRPLTLIELAQVWLNPNLVRSLPQHIKDLSKDKFAQFRLTEIDAWQLAGSDEIPVTAAELTIQLNFGEEELTLRGVQELTALDSQPVGEATAYNFGSKGDSLSEVIRDHGTGELRWDILARPLLDEGKVLIGGGLRSAVPVSITTMRLDL